MKRCCIATQMLGLTNYSHWTHARGLRHCLQSQTLGSKPQKSLMLLALKRLNTFIHVGATELLETSISSLADTLGLRMQGRAYQVLIMCHSRHWLRNMHQLSPCQALQMQTLRISAAGMRSSRCPCCSVCC